MTIREVFRMALMAIRTNKLRSILTMLGVTIGVFSVIGVMTALSVIQGSIESGLSFLGSNMFQFAKYPTMSTSDRRPPSRTGAASPSPKRARSSG
jgi:putative ABC transport system permease protein